MPDFGKNGKHFHSNNDDDAFSYVFVRWRQRALRRSLRSLTTVY